MQLNKKHLKEIKDMFDALDTNHTGYVSFKLMMDTFGGNGLFKEDELVEAMHTACGSKSLRTKANKTKQKISNVGAICTLDSHCILTFEQKANVKNFTTGGKFLFITNL